MSSSSSKSTHLEPIPEAESVPETPTSPLKPLCVCVYVSNKSPHWETAWSDTAFLSPIVLDVLREKNHLDPSVADTPYITLLVVFRYTHKVFFAFDVEHSTYVPSLAHLPEHNRLPIMVVNLSSRNKAWPTYGPNEARTNTDIAEIHELLDPWSVLPFAVDFSDSSLLSARVNGP
ncbi:hypothetical protein BDW69DRAFT_183983 [Aspergillus filifer]